MTQSQPISSGQDRPIWRQCELALASWLEEEGYVVESTCDATGNTQRSNAPLIQYAGRSLRAPDFQSKKGGLAQYWEVKYRSRPFRDPTTGESVITVLNDQFTDYLAVERATSCPVWIVVYCQAVGGLGQWLRIQASVAAAIGRIITHPNLHGTSERYRAWPLDRMEKLDIPPLQKLPTDPPPFSADEPIPAIAPDVYRDAEAAVRSSHEPGHQVPALMDPVTMLADTMKSEHEAGLEVLRLKLGLRSTPRYSVTLVGDHGIELRDALGLLEYGIRVFLVTSTQPADLLAATAAFRESRLLEWAHLPTLSATKGPEWIVDGDPTALKSFDTTLVEAEEKGGINYRQYRIVHAQPDANVLVTAGAGTGKTETMAERLVFLLATSEVLMPQPGLDAGARLGLDEVALVTFTREAAREMRERLSRTLSLRQRLCPMCVHPTVLWLTQLSRTHISTIHLFAKELIRRFGAGIGFSPGFRVSPQTLLLRERFTRSLSEELKAWYARNSADTPPIHQWVEHVEAVWEALENNGVPIIRYQSVPDGHASDINWGDGQGGEHTIDHAAPGIVRSVIEKVAHEVAQECIRNQVLRTSQLVPAALTAMTRLLVAPSGRSRLRFLFVDEFQDTDSMQIELLLTACKALGANMFTVGDVKQGVYRFRGASGDAFTALKARTGEDFPLVEFELQQNFRSDGKLLGSMERYFHHWKQQELLPPQSGGALVARPSHRHIGKPLELVDATSRDWRGRLPTVVAKLRSEDAGASIAILCRRNSHAQDARAELRSSGIECKLVIGGNFFRSEAVREARVLLEALLDPADHAAVLELCETRWSGRLFSGGNAPLHCLEQSAWDGLPKNEPIAWGDRLIALVTNGAQAAMSDLEPVRKRLVSLSNLQWRMSAVSVFVACVQALSPASCKRDADSGSSDREQYGLDLSHLVSLMDSQFAESSATLASILEWLKIQIATNRVEDSPRLDETDSRGLAIALTAHKAKGLEYDFVVIPNTFTPYGTPRGIESEVHVLPGKDPTRTRQLLWTWSPGRRQEFPKVITNRASSDPLSSYNQTEVRREETRLLYVAMTRARRRLVIFTDGAGANAGIADTWSKLLCKGNQP